MIRNRINTFFQILYRRYKIILIGIFSLLKVYRLVGGALFLFQLIIDHRLYK
jgi:hypothetical protein